MSPREIPSFAALQAFEAAARHMSFTKAAEELFLSQSAISRQVQALEDSVGTSLFRRAGNRLVLTDPGQNYRDEIAPHLEGIRNATVRLMAFKGTGERLRVCVLPTLGMKWLVPRLPASLKRHPEVQVELSTRVRPPDWADAQFDVAIQHGEATRSGIMSVPLLGEELVVVGAPQLPRGKVTCATLAELPLLQQSTRPAAWANWFEHAGLTHDNP